MLEEKQAGKASVAHFNGPALRPPSISLVLVDQLLIFASLSLASSILSSMGQSVPAEPFALMSLISGH